jgi:hypothetical protein
MRALEPIMKNLRLLTLCPALKVGNAGTGGRGVGTEERGAWTDGRAMRTEACFQKQERIVPPSTRKAAPFVAEDRGLQT